jgi:hypothetical protein
VPTRSLLVLIVLAPTLHADEAKSARQIVERAIAASGGAKLLASQQALSGTSRGTIALGDAKRTVENAWTVEGLDKMKWAADLTTGDQTLNIVLVLDGKRGWIQGNGGASSELKAELLAPLRLGFTALRLAETLTPLLDRETKLSHLGELKVDDRPTVGIKVTRKGMPDMDLYFDKKTHLPAKAEIRLKELNDVEATYAAFFADYKKVNGQMVATRLTVKRDDAVVLTMLRSNIEAKAKATEGTFARP